jgi:transcriptional regulator with XRE-family HTH domain
MPEDWWDYVTRIAGPDATQKDIADRTGIEASTLSRWKFRKNPPAVEGVLQFARGYGQNPVAALIVAGYLRADEVDGVVEIVTTATSELSIRQLVGKIRELFNELQSRVPPVVGDGIDEGQDWPESFFEGVGHEPPPVRRRKDGKHRS